MIFKGFVCLFFHYKHNIMVLMTIPCIRLCQPPASYQNTALLGLDFLILNNSFDHGDVDKSCNYLPLPAFFWLHQAPGNTRRYAVRLCYSYTKAYYIFLDWYLFITITVFFNTVLLKPESEHNVDLKSLCFTTLEKSLGSLHLMKAHTH